MSALTLALFCLPALSASVQAESPAYVGAPAAESFAQLCSAHPAGCDCPGCRAFFDACDQPCPLYEGDAGPGATDGYSDAGADEVAGAQAPPMTGPVATLSGGLGAVAVASSASPAMIGDFFAPGYRFAATSPIPYASVAVAGGDRIPKFADNNSPIPTDRVFFNYHHFHNSVVDFNSIAQDTNRFTFGLEKTFWGGIGSLEFRAPFTASVDATQAVGAAETLGTEFGNLSLNLKMLAYDSGGLAIGGGLGMVFPTADDAVIIDGVGTSVGSIANEAFYLQPFLGIYHRPNNRLFQQFVSQVSFDVSGDYITVTDPSFFGASGADRINGQSLLFVDYSLGYWIYRARCCDAIVTGIAPMIELHYTSTLDPLDIPAIDANIFEDDFRRDVLNMTGGVLFELGRYTTLRAAGVAPMRGGTDRLFDAEFGLQLNHRY